MASVLRWAVFFGVAIIVIVTTPSIGKRNRKHFFCTEISDLETEIPTLKTKIDVRDFLRREIILPLRKNHFAFYVKIASTQILLENSEYILFVSQKVCLAPRSQEQSK